MPTKGSRSKGPGAVLLAPGAGADRDHHTLVALEEHLDLPVFRMDFPYRKEGRKAPDRAPKLMAAVVEEAERACAQAGVAPERLVLGGRSMGGRMCSMAVAAGLPAAGLALLSYPLHPPGKPEKLRTEHFPDLTVPCLFLAGVKDTFGSPAEQEAAAEAIPAPVTFRWMEPPDAGHSPKRRDDEIVAGVQDWLGGLG